MTEEERNEAIEKHRIAYEKTWIRKHKARLARYERNSRRGLVAALARMVEK